jgi:hypothetical protein
MNEKLTVGNRLRLSGYDWNPSWLQEQKYRTATIIRFIPGQNDSPAVVAHLDAPISVDGVTGEIVVLELRYQGASWDSTNPVHIELCDFEPEAKTWKDRRQGKWISRTRRTRSYKPLNWWSDRRLGSKEILGTGEVAPGG